jgi:hypothetical protein
LVGGGEVGDSHPTEDFNLAIGEGTDHIALVVKLNA